MRSSSRFAATVRSRGSTAATKDHSVTGIRCEPRSDLKHPLQQDGLIAERRCLHGRAMLSGVFVRGGREDDPSGLRRYDTPKRPTAPHEHSDRELTPGPADRDGAVREAEPQHPLLLNAHDESSRVSLAGLGPQRQRQRAQEDRQGQRDAHLLGAAPLFVVLFGRFDRRSLHLAWRGSIPGLRGAVDLDLLVRFVALVFDSFVHFGCPPDPPVSPAVPEPVPCVPPPSLSAMSDSFRSRLRSDAEMPTRRGAQTARAPKDVADDLSRHDGQVPSGDRATSAGASPIRDRVAASHAVGSHRPASPPPRRRARRSARRIARLQAGSRTTAPSSEPRMLPRP